MHGVEYLSDVVILLVISIFIVVTLSKLRISPVLGYLLAGAMIGRNGFDIIAEPGYAEALSEYGVVFLLFVIGLELTFERLMKMRRYVFGFGGLQLLLSAIAIYFALDFGWNFIFAEEHIKQEPIIIVIIACALAFSSTAIVLQVLAESGKKTGRTGRLSLAVLLMQDLAVVPLLAILPILSNKENVAITMSIASGKAICAILFITIFGRWLIKPLFSLIASAKKDEVYVTTTLLIVLSAALATSQLGLSTAMGAFMAGIIIAETEYRNRVEDSIMPFQGIFLSLFFITVGMSIDWRFIMQYWDNVFFAAIALMIIKASVIYLICKIFKVQKGVAINASILLSQGSEFAFILFNLAAAQNILHKETAQFLLMTVSLTMALTPLLAILGNKIENKFDMMQLNKKRCEEDIAIDFNHHVILAGFGRAGKVIAYMLDQTNISYVAVESNASLAKSAYKSGFPVYHGDLGSIEMANFLRADRAATVILSMSDKISVRKAVKSLSENFPSLNIISRVEDLRHGKLIKRVGQTTTVPSIIETGMQLGSVALKEFGVVDHAVIAMKDRMRKNNYNFIEELDLFKQ
ncbi:MAG: cation:proton antiporter [Proteobacteria bacterium]|nr:cation:proton antiporter [Pseudomonadota bacterium]